MTLGSVQLNILVCCHTIITGGNAETANKQYVPIILAILLLRVLKAASIGLSKHDNPEAAFVQVQVMYQLRPFLNDSCHHFLFGLLYHTLHGAVRGEHLEAAFGSEWSSVGILGHFSLCLHNTIAL